MQSCKYIFVLALCPLFLNCATTSTQEDIYRDRIDQLSLKLKDKTKQLNLLKAEQLINARQNTPLSDQRINLSARLSEDTKSFTEEENYKNILQEYKAKNGEALEVSVLKHLEIFPKGQYADNALYWLASHYYKNKNYGQALKFYNQLVENYETSDKRGAGLLAKALTYQKLQLNAQAKMVIEQVYKEFPKTSFARKAKTLSKEL